MNFSYTYQKEGLLTLAQFLLNQNHVVKSGLLTSAQKLGSLSLLTSYQPANVSSNDVFSGGLIYGLVT